MLYTLPEYDTFGHSLDKKLSKNTRYLYWSSHRTLIGKSLFQINSNANQYSWFSQNHELEKVNIDCRQLQSIFHFRFHSTIKEFFFVLFKEKSLNHRLFTF